MPAPVCSQTSRTTTRSARMLSRNKAAFRYLDANTPLLIEARMRVPLGECGAVQSRGGSKGAAGGRVWLERGIRDEWGARRQAWAS